MTALAAWSCTSPSRRSSSSRGVSPLAATTRFDSLGPDAACAAMAAAARVCACGVPLVSRAISSSRDSDPLNSSLAGDGGGLGLGLEDDLGVDAAAGLGDDDAAAGLAKPPSATRAAAAERTASVSAVELFVESADSRSTMSTTPSGRGVGSTHTPESFCTHHRLWPTKELAPPISKTAKPLITVQPVACCTRSELPKESSVSISTPPHLAMSSFDGSPVSRQRLPASCFFPISALSVAFSEKLFGQPARKARGCAALGAGCGLG